MLNNKSMFDCRKGRKMNGTIHVPIPMLNRLAVAAPEIPYFGIKYKFKIILIGTAIELFSNLKI
jgi:hypothetical protein